MVNRIIVPANYTFEVIIKVDPTSGQSELQIRNRSRVQISMWQVAGLLAKHVSNIMESLLSGKLKQIPVQEDQQQPPAGDGGDGGANAS